MIEIRTPIDTQLTHLDIAQERYAKAQEYLEVARLPYTYAIQVLQEAMATDGNVLEAMDAAKECSDLYQEAQHEAQEAAVKVWGDGGTDGRKEWSQDGWEVRLRTSKTPKVGDVGQLVGHLAELKAAETAIKKVVFNKADTVKLHESLEGGIMGLEVTQETTASFKKS